MESRLVFYPPSAYRSLVLSSKHSSARVLIVDDHRVVRLGLRQLLKTLGITRAGEAASAELALEAAETAQPDVVITDIAMGDMDGIELTRRIKRDYPDVRVLVVSMFDEAYWIRRALEAGADGYIVKQNIPVALEEALDAVLGGQRYLCIDSRKRVEM